MRRWSLVGLAGFGVAIGCGGAIDGSTLDAGTDAVDAGQPVDSGVIFVDVSVRADTSVVRADSTAPADTGITSFDSTVSFDSSADVTTSTCSSNMPFTPIMWAPPTPLHQGKCTPAQINAYITTLSTQNGPFTSGNAACDACLQTDETAPEHGPIILQPVMGKEEPAELNFGGCVANFDGMKAAGGCGNRLNNESDCTSLECEMCSDFMNPTPGGPTETCEQQVLEAGGACAADNVPAECNAELMGDGGVQVCVGMFQTILSVWCGP
jgi:hypothetical protein